MILTKIDGAMTTIHRNKALVDYSSNDWENAISFFNDGRKYLNLNALGLTTLCGMNEVISLSVHANANNLLTLVGAPREIKGGFAIDGNGNLKSLIGGPTIVSGIYSADRCGLTDLMGIAQSIGDNLWLSDNKLTSLQGIIKIKTMNGQIWISGCPIVSHILGVFMIRGCYGLNCAKNDSDQLMQAIDIVNFHIEKGRAGLLPCQKELIEAGLADFAQI
jgi:hypothetical protein